MPEAFTSEKESQEVHLPEKGKELPPASPTALASKSHSSPFPLETCTKLPGKKSESKLDQPNKNEEFSLPPLPEGTVLLAFQL